MAAGAALWLAWWPLAAACLAGLIVMRGDPRLLLVADLLVIAGLFGVADAPWVALLLALTFGTREHDERGLWIILLAAVGATFFPFDWTILTGLLVIVAGLRALARVRDRLRPARYQR